ncbi:MAG TPA: hypothetical protein VGR98_23745 [Streptosporangiaceae bacterium]|nr:hypothetical protein [Streptosporangiaceae bacterium]
MDVATIRDAGQREARAEQEQFAAASGPGAVAEAAWRPGRPSPEEIAEKYRIWMENERAKGAGARGERGLSGTLPVDTSTGEVIEQVPVPSAARGALVIVPPPPQTDLPGPRATTLAEIRSTVIATTSALRDRFRELRDIAPAREPARLLKAGRRWLRPRERRTPPTAFRVPFTLPETPSPAEMTIIETPFRIPRYMDHPEWRPC